jgi:hypothetical protein
MEVYRKSCFCQIYEKIKLFLLKPYFDMVIENLNIYLCLFLMFIDMASKSSA